MGKKRSLHYIPHLEKKPGYISNENSAENSTLWHMVISTTIEFFPRPANEISEHLNVITNGYFSGDENYSAGLHNC